VVLYKEVEIGCRGARVIARCWFLVHWLNFLWIWLPVLRPFHPPLRFLIKPTLTIQSNWDPTASQAPLPIKIYVFSRCKKIISLPVEYFHFLWPLFFLLQKSGVPSESRHFGLSRKHIISSANSYAPLLPKETRKGGIDFAPLTLVPQIPDFVVPTETQKGFSQWSQKHFFFQQLLVLDSRGYGNNHVSGTTRWSAKCLGLCRDHKIRPPADHLSLSYADNLKEWVV